MFIFIILIYVFWFRMSISTVFWHENGSLILTWNHTQHFTLIWCIWQWYHETLHHFYKGNLHILQKTLHPHLHLAVENLQSTMELGSSNEVHPQCKDWFVENSLCCFHLLKWSQHTLIGSCLNYEPWVKHHSLYS